MVVDISVWNSTDNSLLLLLLQSLDSPRFLRSDDDIIELVLLLLALALVVEEAALPIMIEDELEGGRGL